MLAVLAEPIVLLALGHKWIEAIPVIQVLAIVFATETLGAAVQPLAMAFGRNDLVFRRSLQGLVTRVPLMLAGLWLGGMQGFLIARASFALPTIVFNNLIAKQVIDLPITSQLQDNWRTIMAVLGMALVGFGLSTMLDFGSGHVGLIARIAVVGAMCSAAYLAILFLSWRMLGKPEGPERDIVDAFEAVLRKAGQVIRPRSC